MTTAPATDSACGACHDEPVTLGPHNVGQTETIRPGAPVPGPNFTFLLGSVEAQ